MNAGLRSGAVGQGQHSGSDQQAGRQRPAEVAGAPSAAAPTTGRGGQPVGQSGLQPLGPLHLGPPGEPPLEAPAPAGTVAVGTVAVGKVAVGTVTVGKVPVGTVTVGTVTVGTVTVGNVMPGTLGRSGAAQLLGADNCGQPTVVGTTVLPRLHDHGPSSG